jgi:hypothetical protein
MYRLHPDDFRHTMMPGQFSFLVEWLERSGAIVVMPDDVRVANNAMPGTFERQKGRFGVTEPFPPYDGERDIIEKAKANDRQAD